jgi:superfamily I DNA/RNA helicase
LLKDFYSSLNQTEKAFVDKVINIVQTKTRLYIDKKFNYVKFSVRLGEPSVFYFSRNGYNEVLIKFRKQVEGITSYPGERVTIKEDFSKVYKYIQEAYGILSEEAHEFKIPDEVENVPTKHPQELDNGNTDLKANYKSIEKLNSDLANLINPNLTMFNLVLNEETSKRSFIVNEQDQAKLVEIYKNFDSYPPFIKIICLDPYKKSKKNIYFELDANTEIENIEEQLYGYLDLYFPTENSIKKVTKVEEITPQVNKNEEDLQEFNLVDSIINEHVVYPRKIFLSTKFKKSIEKAQSDDRVKVFQILEELEKAPKAPEFLNFLKSYNVDKIFDLFKIRVNDVQRLAFTYFHQDGYSALRMVDFIPDHEFEYLKKIKPDLLTYNLWSSYNPEASVKIPLLNDFQKTIVHDTNYPAIIFGAAGSGKTSISLEKYLSIHLELLENKIPISKQTLLYLTFNPKMAEDIASQIRLFYPQSHSMTIDEFFIDLLGDKSIKVQTYEDFAAWFEKTFMYAYDLKNKRIATSIDVENPANVAYTYYRGVFKGSFGENFEREIQAPHLNQNQLFDYLESEGFSNEAMDSLWQVFIQYENFLISNRLMHDNDIAFKLLSNIKLFEAKYLNLIVDETQDLTQVQLYTLLKLSKDYKVYFFGDSNQTINPTLFTLGMLNSTIYQLTDGKLGNINSHTLKKTYRSSKGLVEYTNKLVDLRKEWIASQGEEFDYKHESNDLDTDTRWAARVHDLTMIERLIQKTLNNPNAIVLVPNHKIKMELLSKFDIKDDNQNRIYTIFEAKGLEWESVLLYKFVGSELPKFIDMFEGQASRSTIHRMVFNKYYVACTRARKTTLVLDDFVHEGIKDKLFGSIHEIREEDILDAYFNNDNSPEAWLKEAKALFAQYEYRKAKISFEKAKDIKDSSVDEFIYICSSLEKTKQDKTYELSNDLILLLKEKEYFNHLINYYQLKSMWDYVKLIKVYQGEKLSDEELKTLLLEINLDSKDEELIRKTDLMKAIEEEEESYKKRIREALK